MTFAFIRHGQTDWNRDDKLQGSSDIPLNAQGREQAHEAAGILADGGWEVVVSSPLQRARETAKIIAHDLGLELGPSYPALVERDYGPLEGRSSSETVARSPSRLGAVSSLPTSRCSFRHEKISSPPITAHSVLVQTPTWKSPTGRRLYIV